MAVRLGTHTGKGLAALIREQFSLRLTGLALVCVLLANTGLVVSEFAGIGAAFELLGVSRYLVIPIAAVSIWALVIFGSYSYAERIFLVLSLGFLAYPIAVILAHPNWGHVASDLAVPHLSASSAFLLLGVALIGTTVSPYMQLYAAAGVVDRGDGPEDYRAARLDAISGALFACFIAMTIIIATGAAIGGRGPCSRPNRPPRRCGRWRARPPWLCSPSACSERPRWRAPSCRCPPPTAISEAVGVERSVSRRFTEAPLFLGLFTSQIALGAAVAMTPVNLIKLLIGTQVLQGIVTPVVLTYILILCNRREVLGAAVNRPAFRLVATIAVVGISLMSLLLLGDTLLGFLGLA